MLYPGANAGRQIIDTAKKHESEWRMMFAIHTKTKSLSRWLKKPFGWPDVGHEFFVHNNINELNTIVRVQVPPSALSKNKGSGKMHLPEPFSIFNRAVNKQYSVHIGIQYAYSLSICTPNG
ncbi:hypothetical protein [Desulfosarcina ovata]|uniref:hypothetical protein n=1 Tax=Desulfosarcina ovata TaxID=83564 RepID=UPI0012D3463C|nr:hypothetical protein [Desulfosarcina ovata]